MVSGILGRAPISAEDEAYGILGNLSDPQNQIGQMLLAAGAKLAAGRGWGEGIGGALSAAGDVQANNQANRMRIINAIAESERAKAQAGATQAYRDAQLDMQRERNAQGNWAMQPGNGPGANGATVPGAWKMNRRTGALEFSPGVELAPRGGGGALTYNADPNKLRLDRERIVLSTAKADPMFAADPEGTIKKYQGLFDQRFGTSAPASPPPGPLPMPTPDGPRPGPESQYDARPESPTSAIPLSTGAFNPLTRFGFGAGLPQRGGGQADAPRLLNEAREAVRKGADPAKVRERLKSQYGIQADF